MANSEATSVPPSTAVETPETPASGWPGGPPGPPQGPNSGDGSIWRHPVLVGVLLVALSAAVTAAIGYQIVATRFEGRVEMMQRFEEKVTRHDAVLGDGKELRGALSDIPGIKQELESERTSRAHLQQSFDSASEQVAAAVSLANAFDARLKTVDAELQEQHKQIARLSTPMDAGSSSGPGTLDSIVTRLSAIENKVQELQSMAGKSASRPGPASELEPALKALQERVLALETKGLAGGGATLDGRRYLVRLWQNIGSGGTQKRIDEYVDKFKAQGLDTRVKNTNGANLWSYHFGSETLEDIYKPRKGYRRVYYSGTPPSAVLAIMEKEFPQSKFAYMLRQSAGEWTAEPGWPIEFTVDVIEGVQ